MSAPSESVLAAIRAAVESAPGNHDLRIHLARLLLDSGRAEEALTEATTVLSAEPDRADALRLASEASAAAGDTAKAQRFERLLNAIDQAPPSAAEPENPPEADNVVRLKLVKGGAADENWRVERSDIKLADVGGLDAVKRRLELSLFAQLRNPEMRKFFGRSLRGGLLLYGPPGCGKTFIARATAGELGARFLSVGLQDVLDMYIGESERKLHELFETARRSAPCVMFIDEIDALGRKRSLQRHSAGRDLVNQLLAEMDSIDAANDGLFILSATNHPWDVDTALRRPGRFDRMIFVGPPDQEARKAILAFHMRGRTAGRLDLETVAGRTNGFSGADLAHLCDSAAEAAMEDSLKSGQVRPIEPNDFHRALKEVRPSTKAWLETARNYAMFANEGGAYDDLLAYLRECRMV